MASFSSNVRFTAIGSASSIIFLFVETMISARVLNPTEFGIYVLIITNVNFFAMMIDGGIKTALTQLIASTNFKQKLEFMTTGFFWRYILLLVFSTLFWLVQSFFFTGEIARYAVFMPFLLIVVSLDEFLYGMLQGFHLYKQLAIAQFVRSASRLSLTLALLLGFELGIYALLISWFCSFLIVVIYQFLVLPRPNAFVVERDLSSQMFRFGLPIYLGRFLWFLSIRVNILLLAAFLGPASIAIFDVASRIPQAFQRFIDSYFAVYYPTMTTVIASQDQTKIDDMLNQSFRLISFLTACATLVAILFGREIIVLLFSEKYAVSAPLFGLLMMSLHVVSLLSLMGYTLTAAGLPWRSTLQDGFKAALIVLANLILIPLYGVMGAALASVAAVHLSSPLTTWLLRQSGIVARIMPMLSQAAFLGLIFAYVYFMQPRLLLLKIVIIAVFVSLNFTFSTISKQDFGLLFSRFAKKPLTVKPA